MLVSVFVARASLFLAHGWRMAAAGATRADSPAEDLGERLVARLQLSPGERIEVSVPRCFQAMDASPAASPSPVTGSFRDHQGYDGSFMQEDGSPLSATRVLLETLSDEAWQRRELAALGKQVRELRQRKDGLERQLQRAEEAASFSRMSRESTASGISFFPRPQESPEKSWLSFQQPQEPSFQEEAPRWPWELSDCGRSRDEALPDPLALVTECEELAARLAEVKAARHQAERRARSTEARALTAQEQLVNLQPLADRLTALQSDSEERRRDFHEVERQIDRNAAAVVTLKAQMEALSKSQKAHQRELEQLKAELGDAKEASLQRQRLVQQTAALTQCRTEDPRQEALQEAQRDISRKEANLAKLQQATELRLQSSKRAAEAATLLSAELLAVRKAHGRLLVEAGEQDGSRAASLTALRSRALRSKGAAERCVEALSSLQQLAEGKSRGPPPPPSAVAVTEPRAVGAQQRQGRGEASASSSRAPLAGQPKQSSRAVASSSASEAAPRRRKKLRKPPACSPPGSASQPALACAVGPPVLRPITSIRANCTVKRQPMLRARSCTSLG